MDTSTINGPKPGSILAVSIGAIGMLIVVGILSLPYFRPTTALAVQGAGSVSCGSPDILMSNASSGPGIVQFSSSGTSTQQIVNCTAPFGGATQAISLRAKRARTGDKVTYSINVDGMATPLVTVGANTDTDAVASGLVSGWQITKDFISTTVPIKFNTSLSISATVEPVSTGGAPTIVAAHVQYTPDAQEVPVKFLNVPLINVNGPIHAILDGQPIQTHNNP